MVASGWVSDGEGEDFLLRQDRRLDPPVVMDPASFPSKLGIPHRTIFPCPERRNDDVVGYQQLATTDVAALCIWLERLGFRIEVSSLCDQLRPGLDGRSYLTDEEISVLFYDGNRHRMGSVTISAPHRGWCGMRTVQHKTEGGYRVEYTADDEGIAMSLTVHAPKFRKPKPRQVIECPGCGMTYVKGSRLDEREHRKSHRRWAAVVDPKPRRRFAEALERDLDAAWVGADAPEWKRKEVYERARLFRREFGYSFVQWSVEDDPDPIGFLFSDGEGRITGACAFRPQRAGGERPWRLDWIWLNPTARRLGQLSRQWDRFRQRFGVFDIEPPVSDAMKAFLRKRGAGDLIR
ncbi:C2H2-type zinc finger protein [Sinorhizobium meliloti]|uniref:C2H2-type zinc finger protein n=1 Tax=Rhizobium meliloti TaxID=382 RepID=UPI002072E7BC|nr:C2H2-type zinc finger protein [Sinorhizobium meliloti]MCM5689772.1 C2H2-type zinc finger protein [Sinorhizobium meliloti]